MVRLMTAWRIPQEGIYGVLKISKRSFHRHYKDDVKFGLIQTLAAVNGNLYRAALGGGHEAVNAGKYLSEDLKQQLNRHHGGDLEGVRRDILADADVVKPTGPVPENPVL
jgi:hypothetical protein